MGSTGAATQDGGMMVGMMNGRTGNGDGGGPGDLSGDLRTRLREVGRAVAPDEIGDLWIFPPLPELERSSEFVLFTRILGEERRGVYSAGVRRRNGGGEPGDDGEEPGDGMQEIVEHGVVPTDRLPGFLRSFRSRLEAEGEPLHLAISGRVDRWRRLTNGADGAKEGAAES